MTKKLTTTGILLALGLILSMLKLFDAPYGGSVTLVSMLPILLISVLYDTKWGVLSGIVFSVLTMLLSGVPAPPTQTVFSYLLVVILDYLLAFGVLGLAGGLYRGLSTCRFALPIATGAVVFLRFLCHFLSGILIWSAYALPGYSATLYSLLYNGSYMLFEFILTVAGASLLVKWLPRLK